MPLLTRSASLTGYVDLARAVGLDPYRMAAAQDIPAAALGDADLLVPADAVGRLLEASARRSGTSDFGLRLAETRDLSNLGPLGLVAREQSTLRGAIETMINYMWFHNQALTLRLEVAADVAVLRASIGGRRPDSSRQSNELTVAVSVRSLRRFVGQAWRPQGVAFTHAAPADLSAHRRVLGVTPQFSQDFNGVIIAAADLDRPIVGAGPVAARRIERYVQQVEGHRRQDPVATARDLVLALLPTGNCTAQRVAAHMGVDRRTLHRWLGRGGVSFIDLLDEARGKLSLTLLAAPDRSMTQIADLLGYASLSAFSRWFHRRFGVSPTQARKPLASRQPTDI